MIVPPNKLVEGCVGGELSAGLGFVYFTGERLEATDSYVAVSVPVTAMPGDRPGVIPPLLLRLARDPALYGNQDAPVVELKEKTASLRGVLGMNRSKPATRPPTYAELRAKHAAAERPFRVAVDVRKLARVAAALGDDEIVIEFSGDAHDALLVYSARGEGEGEAIVMPLRSTMAPPRPGPDEDEETSEEADE